MSDHGHHHDSHTHHDDHHHHAGDGHHEVHHAGDEHCHTASHRTFLTSSWFTHLFQTTPTMDTITISTKLTIRMLTITIPITTLTIIKNSL